MSSSRPFLKRLYSVGPNVEIGENIILGRNHSTGIKKLRCSREQVILSSSSSGDLSVTRIGFHPSFLNGKPLGKGVKAILQDKDKLELLRGELTFEVNMAKQMKLVVESKSEDCWHDGADHFFVYSHPKLDARSKIAGFDLDWTLIKTRSGRVFPRDESDWQFAFTEVPGQLRKAYNDGYKIVIFTNQKGIHSGKFSKQGFKRKIEAIAAKIPVPIQVLVSSGTGKYRKPMTGMWEGLVGSYNENVTVTEAFYVGDAAGREKDHSNSDRLFALNISYLATLSAFGAVPCTFYTPEEYFLGVKKVETFKMPEFQPIKALENTQLLNDGHALRVPGQELILMVGMPGSGKSSFIHDHLVPTGVISVSRDELKTWQACAAAVEKHLKEGSTVVVDNTNPDKESRGRFIAIAEKLNIPVRCFVMNVTKTQTLHNVRFRALLGPDKAHKDVNEMVLNTFAKKYQAPNTSEGFAAIVSVNFVPKFEDPSLKQLYSMYLLEK